MHLISKKVKSNIELLQSDIVNLLEEAAKSEKSEEDLRWYAWYEHTEDVSRIENVHTGKLLLLSFPCSSNAGKFKLLCFHFIGLSMKTKGYSDNIIKLCDTTDVKYFELLNDISYYLYGKEYDNAQSAFKSTSTINKRDRKFFDHEKLQNHLSSECSKNIKWFVCTSIVTSNILTFAFDSFIDFLQQNVNSTLKKDFILRSLLCARILQAITVLCTNFKKCCSTSSSDEWEKIRSSLIKASLEFWNHWMKDVMMQLMELSSHIFNEIDTVRMLQLYHVSVSNIFYS